MTDLPQPEGKHRSIIRNGTTLLRVLSGVGGLAIILVGAVLFLFFMASADSAWELFPALGFAALCGIVPYLMIRFAFRGPKSG